MATPPDFTSGQVLTAAQMNAIGLWLVKVETIGSGVSSVVVSNAFSADFDDYLIRFAGGTPSTGAECRITLGSTTAGYYYAGQTIDYSGSGQAFSRGANVAYWLAGAFYAGGMGIQFTISNPFATDETTYSSIGADIATNAGSRFYAGYLNNTTSYTAFTATPSTGTLTGGTISVYGMRK